MSLDETFTAALAELPLFRDINRIARNHTAGHLYLVGDVVYNNLVAVVHHKREFHWDAFQFLADELCRGTLPLGWNEPRQSGLGGLRFSHEERGELDLTINLDEIRFMPCMQGGSPNPTIWDYLRRQPVDYQAIAYDWRGNFLIGDGIKAIQRGIARIQNESTAEQYARLKSRSVEQYLREEAQKVGMRAVASN